MTWRKVASVTTGGKPHFYRMYTTDGQWLASVIWNRAVRAYGVEVRKRLDNGIVTGTLVGYVGTVQSGKKLAESSLFQSSR